MHRSDGASSLHFELSLWFRSLESFCSNARYAFRGEKDAFAEKQNFKNEFHITHAVLLKCGELIEELGSLAAKTDEPVARHISECHKTIKPLIVSNNALARNQSLNFSEWNAWCELISERIAGCDLVVGFDGEYEDRGLAFLPEPLTGSVISPEFDIVDRTDLRSCLSKLGGILRSLDVVREMLNNDAPLKPALAIFAFLYEAVNELVAEIGDRLAMRSDETSDVFAMLDATAYTLAIESKKVYSHELSAVIGTRSASLVFARVEAAFGLFNDNIRQLLAGFAKLAAPESNATDLFPEFAEKLEQSIDLRAALWSILHAVRAAESEATDSQMSELHPRLEEFLGIQLNYLFYKDRETFERFCEEILSSTAGPDVRPLLHRFSAYVETLFNQVGMRVVLANHPFTPEP